MDTIWTRLPRPFFVLAPMEDVTDTVFRQIVNECGRPDLSFTEFTNADGLFSRGYDYVAKRLLFGDSEKPLIAQIWGINPENFYKAAKLVRDRGFDGVDINMGCPEKSVTARGACSALIDNPDLASEIIRATQEGAAGKIPVSVKTRIGTKEIKTQEWAGFLLEHDLDALTIHGRTAKEMSEFPAHWDEIKKVVDLRNQMNLTTPIIGNGDVESREDGLRRVEQTGVDGVMIGRGIFKDPWLFNKDYYGDEVTQKEKFEMYLKQILLYEKTWKDTKYFPVLKKFAKCYIKSMDGASVIRDDLMQTQTFEEYKEKVSHYASIS